MVYTLRFFSLQNAVCFIILTYLVPVLFTFYIFIQQIYVLNILNMVYTLRFFSSKCSLFHNSNLFCSCIIHILYIYSTYIGIEYFKHGIYSPFFPLQNAVCFIILTYLVPVLFTFYIFIQQIYVLNILNMVYTLRLFFSSKCSLFHNSNVFGSCIIHILYIYSTNIRTEYFKHGIYSTFFPLQNAICSIIQTYLVPVLFTFYIFIQQI